MLDFNKAIAAIEHAKNILILPSSPVDGDSLGSALALYDVLKGMEKSATVVLTSDIPDIYKFLPNISHIHSSAEMYADFMITLHLKDQILEDIRHEIVDDHVNIIVTPSQGRFSPEQVSFPEPKKHYDLIITVDCADLTQLGEFYRQHFQIFSEVPSINIDHHISNKNYASLNIVDPSYCSTTHILYDLFLELSTDINPDVATLLLAGIITDTGSFQNTNTTPEAFDVAAELIDLGGRQQEIIQHIYKTKQLNSLKLWGKILSKIQIDNEYQLMWTNLTNIDLKETETTNQDKGEIMDELLSNAEDARIVILLEERPGNVLHGSIRVNNDEINAVTIAEHFGGGGHQRAAGFNISDATVESHESTVLKFIRKYLDDLDGKNTEPTQSAAADLEPSEQGAQDDFELKPVAAPAPEALDTQVAPTAEVQELQSDEDLEQEFSDMPPAPEMPAAEMPAAASIDSTEAQTVEPTQPSEPTTADLEPVIEQAPAVEQQSDPEQIVADQGSQPAVSELDADFDSNTPAAQQQAEPQLQQSDDADMPAEEDFEPSTPELPAEEETQESAIQEPVTIERQASESDFDDMEEGQEQVEYDTTDIDSELAPNASEFGGDDSLTMDTEEDMQEEFLEEEAPEMTLDPLAQESEQNQETEERIKGLSQKFFTEEQEQIEQQESQETTAEAANQSFSEIPAFGENLDLSQISQEQAQGDSELEFPPNPFGNTTEPGQMPSPDVPEDL